MKGREDMKKLGFGTMRLPLIPGGKQTDIDHEQVKKMFDYFLEQGFIYAVDGTDGNFSLFYDGNGYDLNAAAEDITALCIGVTSSFKTPCVFYTHMA